MASIGLLRDETCWWDGTEIWAEVEPVAMTYGVRTSWDVASEVLWPC
jgi:hypothetical protein